MPSSALEVNTPDCLLTIGELARRAGVTASAVRYYEELGLLPEPARISGQRRYPESAARLVAAILLYSDAGFTLAEQKALMATHASTPGDRRQLMQRKLAELDEQIARAQAVRESIRHGLRCPHEDITHCPNFNAGITARLAGQPLSRSHPELHVQGFHEVLSPPSGIIRPGMDSKTSMGGHSENTENTRETQSEPIAAGLIPLDELETEEVPDSLVAQFSSLTTPFCWVITVDAVAGYDGAEPSAVGKSGPDDAVAEDVAEALTAGRFFRLVDGTGRELAIGRLYDPSGQSELAPLNDFGRQNLGALNIEFRAEGDWRAA